MLEQIILCLSAFLKKNQAQLYDGFPYKSVIWCHPFSSSLYPRDFFYLFVNKFKAVCYWTYRVDASMFCAWKG